MTSGTARTSARTLPDTLRWLVVGAAALAATGCTSFYEVAIDTPLQSKIDVGEFRRVLVAGFVTELSDEDVDLQSETVRLLQNQLRAGAKLQVLEPDHPPLMDALEKTLEEMGGGGTYTEAEKERYRLEGDRILQDAEFWRRVGEEFQNPLIVTGKVGFESQNRSGFQAEESVVRDPRTSRQRVVRGNRYLERTAFSLNIDFHFVNGRTGETLHKEKFSEEVLYGEDQKVSPLSSYFDLMDRLLPNFLGIISPQRVRGTRVLLQ